MDRQANQNLREQTRRGGDCVRLDGNEIAQLRNQKGWGQNLLAKHAGCSKRTISRAESCQPVRVYKANGIARALRVNLEQILFNSHQPLDQANLPAGLAEYRYTFSALIEEHALGFVGRKWLFEAVDEYRNNPEVRGGYFVIRGAHGTGLSAIIAKLVNDTRCVHFFNTSLQGINRPEQFLAHVCVELIARFRLPYDSLPRRATQDGSFLNKLLMEVSNQLPDGDTVLIAVDALDEVDQRGLPAKTNVLYLPPVLPRGVFVVATTTPTRRVRLEASNLHYHDLDPGSKQNRRDLNELIRKHARHGKFKALLKNSNCTLAHFCEALYDRSEGSFVYARCVLQAIKEGNYTDKTLQALPEGLLAFYPSHWRMMRGLDPGQFKQVYQPVMCTLVAASRPLTAAEIAAASGKEEIEVRETLDTWREFLFEERSGREPARYNIYQKSFKEFLQEKLGSDVAKFRRKVRRIVT